MQASGLIRLHVSRKGKLHPLETIDFRSPEFGGSYEAALRRAVDCGRSACKDGTADRFVVPLDPLNVVLIGRHTF